MPCSRTPRSRRSSAARTWRRPLVGGVPPTNRAGTGLGAAPAARTAGACGPESGLRLSWWAVSSGRSRPVPSALPGSVTLRPSPCHPRSSRMPESTLTALTGREIGSSSTRRLRSEGKIPGVVYGHGSDPIPVAVVAREFQIAMSGEAGLNTLLSLKVDGKDLLTMARDIQHHPVRNVVTHVDFLIVNRDEQISAEVTINLVGEALEVAHGDGIAHQVDGDLGADQLVAVDDQ